MKAKPQKYASPGKVGKVAVKPSRQISIVQPMGKIEKISVKQAEGIIGKHFK